MVIRTWNLALVGYGNVGKAFVRLLVDKTGDLRRDFGIEWRLTGLASRRLGWLANPDGFDPEALLAAGPPPPAPDGPQSVREWLARARAEVLFEASSLSRHTGQP